MSRLDSIGDWTTSTLATRRWLQWINVVAYLGGVVVIVVSLNVLAQRPQMRLQVDATKTRAYSLSEQTRRLLGSLDGKWTIAIVSSATDTDRAIRRQVDEVLRRFDEASPNLGVARINPTDPASLGAFERLLGDLRWTYADRVRQYEAAFDAGAVALDDLLAFAREETGGLRALAAALPKEFEGTEDLQRRAQLLGLLADVRRRRRRVRRGALGGQGTAAPRLRDGPEHSRRGDRSGRAGAGRHRRDSATARGRGDVRPADAAADPRRRDPL